MKNLIVRIEDELHKALKVKCVQEGRSMNEVLVELIKRYAQPEKIKKSKDK